MAAQNGAKVDTGIMRQGASTITDTGQGITGVNRQVDATMQELLGTWRSDAAVVFHEAMGTFDRTVQTIVDRLNTLSQHVTTGANDYDRQDEDNTSNVRQQAATIGGLPGF
ncbi:MULTISPECIES: WXG100 family type VII secretion target [Amycolatopsis]|uniref:ESAT-6-like protein n=1 Tax=Amycolatopsis iheyensis TaxID=2945988 RepID=A0A9X2SRT8_9PSEU|nr:MULTISPECIES: WXG100 family type VII secretion target [Amycolatopsis]MCR6490735.1 WXG100 family type VII secretion target [Amycolatopsis iheyensis]